MKKIKQLFLFCLPFIVCCFSCNNMKDIGNTDDTMKTTEIDSSAYERDLEHAVEEKLLPKYKEKKN